ncbi:MAG: hypothetical protein D6753_04070 [Planctomycetota bacterium]|nr:MAG: hypothetical protein D6753_04070 [Planctomycetota bacterium]
MGWQIIELAIVENLWADRQRHSDSYDPADRARHRLGGVRAARRQHPAAADQPLRGGMAIIELGEFGRLALKALRGE